MIQIIKLYFYLIFITFLVFFSGIWFSKILSRLFSLSPHVEMYMFTMTQSNVLFTFEKANFFH